MDKAGRAEYSEVRVTLLLDEQATLARIGQAVGKIAARGGAARYFVFYAAAHGVG